MTFQSTYADVAPIGYAGQVDSHPANRITTFKNVEVSASIPFGFAVCFKLSSPNTDYDVLLPASQSDLVAGIVVKSEAYERAWTDSDGIVHGELDATGVMTGNTLNVLRKGRILANCVLACVPGDRLFVCSTAFTGNTLGSLSNAATSTDNIDCTKQGQWMTTAAAGGLAWLEVDFVNKP